MQFVYFTKSLQSLDVPGLISFCKDVGLDGVDFTVRPGYPVTPENAAVELPKAAKSFRDAGLAIGLVTAPTGLIDPESRESRGLFEAGRAASVGAIKIGYFPYRGKFDTALADARGKLAGFVRLAERTGVKACYHTHSGGNLGNNAGGLRLLLQDLDPHHIGVFFDTGHTAINGGPVRMELDMIRPWISLVAIKDMHWTKGQDTWNAHVVPAGEGIVRWADFAQGIKEIKFSGTISLHAEYPAKDLETRKELAKRELAFLKERLL
jgi:sugar phosphate isomerase/epimerase